MTWDPMAGFKKNVWTGQSDQGGFILSPDNPTMNFGYGISATAPAANAVVPPAAANAPLTWTDLDFWTGGIDRATGQRFNGAGGLALGGLQGLGNLYMGMQQYGLARDQLQFSKDAFNKNYGAQKITTNNQIRSRNFARNAANPGMYQNMTEIA